MILEKGFLAIAVTVSLVILFFIYKKSYSLLYRLQANDYSVMDKLNDRGEIGFTKTLVAFVLSIIVTGFGAFILLLLFSSLHLNLFGTPLISKSPVVVEVEKDSKNSIPVVSSPPVPNNTEQSQTPNIQEPQRQFTKEEVEALEEKAQYHGDDPTIRARLGLPPKVIQ